tara:strand:+ start:597 stop:1013 length:417 start_codon:yes stop_codon:yes gene_type:complete
MHSDYSMFKELREQHRKHHEECSRYRGVSWTGVYYGWDFLLYVFLSSFPFVYILSRFTNISLWFTIIIHLIMIYLFIAVHNDFHGRLHFQNPYKEPGIPYLHIPDWLMKYHKKRHTEHHLTHDKNFCTIFVGFDHIIE